MKLKARLPKDDANGIEHAEVEFAGNLRNEQLIPVIALIGTEDVLERRGEAILYIADVEVIPEDEREHFRDVMGVIKANRTGAKTGQQTLPIGDEENVEGQP